MVEYTGEYTVNRTAAADTPQTAAGGERNRGDTCRTSRDAGSPPSRANANAIRDAEVTVASPHRYWATTAPPHRSSIGPRGTACSRARANAPSPAVATAAGSRIASTTAESIT